jgi:hypothetical protein
LPHWPWGQPGRYYGRAGYRDDFGGGCSTSKRSLRPCHRICITAYAGWLTVHARRHQREVCRLSPWGDVATPIRPITGWHSLAPSSFTCCPVGAPCGLLSLDPLGIWGREDNRLTTFRRCTRVVRPHLYAGGATSAPEEFGASGPGHIPFWSKRFSSLRLSFVTTPTMLYLGWPYHSILVPNHHCCWQLQLQLTPWLPSRGRRLRCPGAY